MMPITIVSPLAPITMVPKMKVPITIVLPLLPITMVPKMKVNEGCGCACMREVAVVRVDEDADHDRVAD
eukprot:6051688-Prymnesium_polylepis.1